MKVTERRLAVMEVESCKVRKPRWSSERETGGGAKGVEGGK
jgi:hypothetical protein